MKKAFQIMVVAVVLLLGCSLKCFSAGDVTFGWDFHNEPIAKYRLYQTDSSMDYFIDANGISRFDQSKMMVEVTHDPNDITASTTYTLNGVPAGTHFWVLTAVDKWGNESGPSNEVFLTLGPSSPKNFHINLQ